MVDEGCQAWPAGPCLHAHPRKVTELVSLETYCVYYEYKTKETGMDNDDYLSKVNMVEIDKKKN